MDRKIYIGHWQRKSQCKSFGVQNAIAFSKFCEEMCIFFYDITNQAILQNIEKMH